MALYQHELQIPRELLKKDQGFSIDVGGSLIKVVYVDDDNTNGKNDVTIHMASFPKQDLDEALEFIKQNVNHEAGETYTLTGMGSAEYRKHIMDKLNMKACVVPEMECFATALHFFKTNFDEDFYTMSSEEDKDTLKQLSEATDCMKAFQTTEAATGQSNTAEKDSAHSGESDLLFVLGSGGLILKVNPNGTFSFVEAIKTCGKSLLGLGRLCAEAKTFDELMALASKGDFKNVHFCGNDLRINKGGDDGDVYGAIPKDMAICHFEKPAMKSRESFRKEDLASALISAVLENLAQVAKLTCYMHNVKKIYLCGSLVEGSEFVRREFNRLWLTLTVKEPVEMQFLKYSGYLGALGALFKKD